MKLPKLQWLNSPTRWKDSFALGFAILASVETIFAVSAISLDCIWGAYNWIIKLLLLFAVFLLIVVIAFIFKYHRAKKGISFNIRNIKVNIRQGDIFKVDGWKVIPFNEYFDTTVNEIIITKNSLNGTFINDYVENKDELKNIIANETDDDTEYKRTKKNGKDRFQLGRIIRYKDYLLLAFSHFDNNQAHLTQKDYEHCLRVMWKEISRTYSNTPVFIPLLGSGITRFEEGHQPKNTDLLKCMLCTLRTSNTNIKQPITILLTEEIMQEINIYEMKGVK
jgi:hypothetical protein